VDIEHLVIMKELLQDFEQKLQNLFEPTNESRLNVIESINDLFIFMLKMQECDNKFNSYTNVSFDVYNLNVNNHTIILSKKQLLTGLDNNELYSLLSFVHSSLLPFVDEMMKNVYNEEMEITL